MAQRHRMEQKSMLMLALRIAIAGRPSRCCALPSGYYSLKPDDSSETPRVRGNLNGITARGAPVQSGGCCEAAWTRIPPVAALPSRRFDPARDLQAVPAAQERDAVFSGVV